MEEQLKQDAELQVIAFKLGKEEYGANILQVHEIIKILSITRVPKTPSFVEGVINLRGNIIPVINLRKRFGLEFKDYDENSRIIVVDISPENNRLQMGMIVDSVSEVIRLQADQIEPPPAEINDINSTYLQGVGKVGDRLILLLDLDKIMIGQEKAKKAIS